MKKLLLVSVLALLAAAFFLLDLQQWLTLDGLRSGLAQLHHWRAQAPVLTAGSFFLLYILVTALSLPGAAVLTLAAGALFGFLQGLILVSFASSIGATLAFLASRHLFRDLVQARFSNRLTAINSGIERDGALYLFTLRLVPAFPFFLINLLMGLTPIKARTFYWVSQAGMLAGTLVYVNAGIQIAQLESLSGILSPELLIAFVLLGLFPLLAKKLVWDIQRRRVYRQWQKPKHFDRNLIVIGAGAGGLVSAYIGAVVKAKVTLIEAHKMGGDCLNYGCVPSKALIKSARMASQMQDAERYGLESQPVRFSFYKVMERVHQVITQVEPHDSIERYTRLGVEVLQGYARLVDPWTVEISLNDGSHQRLSACSIILATGAKPWVPPLPGLEETGYLTSDTLWEQLAAQDSPPRRLVILGGGPIGCELAQSFARLGCEVTQVELDQRLLAREDEDAAVLVHAALSHDGVRILTGHTPLRTEIEDGEKRLICQLSQAKGSAAGNGTDAYSGSDSGSEQLLAIPFDKLLIAVGRKPQLEGYGLEKLGIETNRTVITNDYLETLYPNIYAIGDVAGPYQFTHTAAHQAWYAAVNALFGQYKRFRADYRIIPRTTFTDPEVASVGFSEAEAKVQGIHYEVTRYELEDLDRAIAESRHQGFVKVLTPPGKDRILGVCIVGEHAGEQLAEFVLAMKHGLGLSKILSTIHTYPTWAEANKYAAGQWKESHAPKRLLRWLGRYHDWRR